MSSAILYKFRASSTFEALPLPGSAARLFDVKKAIVRVNKLDSGSMDFDLSVRNADTNEEYGDEGMHLPRGTRLIVQRLPAARGHGFLARLARNEHAGGAAGLAVGGPGQQHPSGYYTIDSRARDDDEFVSSSATVAMESNEDRELAALQAVTTMQSIGPAMAGSAITSRRGPPQPAGMGPPVGQKSNFHKPMTQNRPNADPELREQEKELQPKKRMTGIPRTFLSLSAPPQTDGNKGEAEQTSLLQPNKIGFKELINRGGGQSESSGRTKSLDYALKITSTTVPEHLQCAICYNVVNNAMLLPWDPEGRTVCESCIRDALTQNGFRCPLTGTDGVSPDDLIPNVGLRKAANMFVKGVMEKLQEIEDQHVEDPATEETIPRSNESNILDGEGVEKGVIVSKRMSLSSRKSIDDDDPFGGGDLFGGDVFAVSKPQTTEEKEEPGKLTKEETNDREGFQSLTIEGASKDDKEANEAASCRDNSASKETMASIENDHANGKDLTVSSDPSTSQQTNDKDNSNAGEATAIAEKPQQSPPSLAKSRHRRDYRRRGPPAGYTMGPAGGTVGSARANHVPSHPVDASFDAGEYGRVGGRGRYSPRGRGPGRYGDFSDNRRGYGRVPVGRGRFSGDRQYSNDNVDISSRGIKRIWEDQLDQFPAHDDNGTGGPNWDPQFHDDRGAGRYRHVGPGRIGRGDRGGFTDGGRGGRWGGSRGGRGQRGRGRGRY